jgi:hypothetical protein
MPNKPRCGYQAPGTYSPSVSTTTVTAIITGVLSLAGAAKSLYDLVTKFSGGYLYAGAAVAAFITWLVVSAFYYKNCLDSPRKFPACSAGVIEVTVPSFLSVADQIFAFAASHDRIDVVVKSIYWDLVSKNASYVNCAPDPPIAPDTDGSPMISEYYHNAAVCAAGLGGSIGAAAGGVAGVFLGALAGGAIAALSCGPFAWLCALIALIVAIIIAVVCAIVGAVVGSQIGRAAATSGRPLPIDTTAPNFPSALSVGDYVTTKGNLTSDADANGMYIYWFVDETTLHGRSTGLAPFNYRDPDANLLVDACPSPLPPIG